MAKKYICEECSTPCVLEVEEDASEPCGCPYKRHYYDWELMKGDEQT